MKKFDIVTILISLFALIISFISIYKNHFVEADIQTIVAEKSQIWVNQNKSISMLVPVNFVNKSQTFGNIYNAKLKIYVKDSTKNKFFVWNQFWRKIPETDSTTGNVYLISRPMEDANTISLLGGDKESKTINFIIKSSEINLIPKKESQEYLLEKNKYKAVMLIECEKLDNWDEIEFEFDYDGNIEIELQKIKYYK